MNRLLLPYVAWPLVGLGALLAVACLTGVWYINKAEADLGRAVRYDVRRLQAAQEMQVQLRHLRYHSMIFMADPTSSRRAIVLADEQGFATAFENFRQAPESEDDVRLAERIARDYDRYQAALDVPETAPAPLKGDDLIRWADAHPMRDLLRSCRELAEHQQRRMNQTLEQSELQNRWAGRSLLAIGVIGVLGGLLSGYASARRYTRAVGLLSVRVQAAQAHLDQEVGTLTVAAPQHLGDVDQQLGEVVGRIQELCQRLQHQEREILRAEQLAAVGQLAAGVAHEVRNPLTGIKFLIEAALRPGFPIPLAPDDLRLIHGEILRLERIVQELLNFARVPALHLQDQDVAELIRRAIDIVRRRADQQRVELLPSIAEPPMLARLDGDQFLSMLSNLLLNALDATPTGGHVRLSAQRTAAGALRIDVIDSGPGIAPEAMEKLFVPFATTKPTGTGLGLTMARRIARDHGGTLTAANLPEGGACFTFELPG